MNSAFLGLSLGLVGAIALIYMLIVVNFHSWSDAFVIVTALPAALAGIVWMLFTTHTPLSVPALTGAILCMGVATANSILVVSFARERLAVTGNALVAAMEAGFTRFRPVLMTALAMIIGMAPMALGLGDRRPDLRDLRHVAVRPGCVQPGAPSRCGEAPSCQRQKSSYFRNRSPPCPLRSRSIRPSGYVI
jgi:multidrug efflux pump subunit AcrB